MKHTGLVNALKDVGIKLPKSRLEFMAMLILGLIEARTVNLKRVVAKMQSCAQEDSIYRRAQRFFASQRLNHKVFMRLMLGIMNKERYSLCVDRTNWQFGKITINILMIAVCDEGLAIPLAFVLLDKQGSSNTLERTELLEKVLEVIKPEQIEVFLADREFIGQDWFKFLVNHNISFAIRIRENSLLDTWFPVKGLFQNLAVGATRTLQHRYCIHGCDLAVAAVRSPDHQLVIIVGNRPANTLIDLYALRWQIESLFKALKSSGFRLEDTHLKHLNRLTNLIALVSLAFLWALKVGHWQHTHQAIRIKSHGRKERSLFRLGLDFIQRALTNRDLDPSLLQQALDVLSCT
jgi:hypothetical protein